MVEFYLEMIMLFLVFLLREKLLLNYKEILQLRPLTWVADMAAAEIVVSYHWAKSLDVPYGASSGAIMVWALNQAGASDDFSWPKSRFPWSNHQGIGIIALHNSHQMVLQLA